MSNHNENTKPSLDFKHPVGTVRVLNFTIKGMDLLGALVEAKMYQSILRPFIVCDFQMRDYDGFGNQLKLVGGEPVTFTVISRENIPIRWNGFVTKQSGEIDIDKRRLKGTIITATNQAYIRNEMNKVTGSWKNIPGSSLIAEIHKTYLGGEPIHRMAPSLGMIGEKEPFILRNERPFDSIAKIRYAITSSAYSKSGAYTYFRDIDGYVLLPLEQLFAEASSGVQKFIEDETVGGEPIDPFATNTNILDFKAMTTFGGVGTGFASIAQSASGVSNHTWNWMENKFKKGPRQNPSSPGFAQGFPAIFGGFAGVADSLMNYTPHDKRMNKISPKDIKAGGEKLTAEMVQNGPGYKMAVLFDLGAKLTVGRGVFAEPIPPNEGITEGFHRLPKDRAGGLGLIINLTHTIKNVGDTRPQGITVVECAQGGFRQ